MDKLQAMSTFVQIADAGSLTGAANRLGKSLPAVVRMLAALEKELKIRLFNRTTRKIALTEEGRLYLERCRKILADIDDAERLLSNDQLEPRGLITITAPVRFGELHVNPVVTSFLKKYPHIHINLILLDRVVDMLDEGIDLAVRIANIGDSSLIAKQVGTIRQVVCASPGVIKTFGEPKHPDDLARLPCVNFTGIATTGAWSFQDEGKRFTVKVDGQFKCNQVKTTVDACSAGLGFGMFFSYQVMPWTERGELAIVLSKFELESLPVNIVFHHSRLMAARIRLFVDYLSRELKASLML